MVFQWIVQFFFLILVANYTKEKLVVNEVGLKTASCNRPGENTNLIWVWFSFTLYKIEMHVLVGTFLSHLSKDLAGGRPTSSQALLTTDSRKAALPSPWCILILETPPAPNRVAIHCLLGRVTGHFTPAGSRLTETRFIQSYFFKYRFLKSPSLSLTHAQPPYSCDWTRNLCGQAFLGPCESRSVHICAGAWHPGASLCSGIRALVVYGPAALLLASSSAVCVHAVCRPVRLLAPREEKTFWGLSTGKNATRGHSPRSGASKG